jgi:hypothetical protein
VISPGNLELADIAPIDLVQRRVTLRAFVPADDWPLSVFGESGLAGKQRNNNDYDDVAADVSQRRLTSADTAIGTADRWSDFGGHGHIQPPFSTACNPNNF